MEKKNVLIISDNFLKGGLERHILNQYNGLKNKINFVFLFSKLYWTWRFKKTCSENEMLVNEQISNSQGVFYILKENLSFQVNDPEIINVFKTYDSLFTIQNLKNDIDKIGYKVDNIGLKEINERTIRKLKKLFLKTNNKIIK